ncbi:ABC transporter substrate-binding protein [Auraticoccus sp. F435]|uniref:ABC transporter substrate-binding protein n=1 Tax=Auraticoccus cholistanensis TaxID=2656650 RepID=A0A6A9UX31_9ACTN|nr:ABC transporter substrate-binding protein [Auraticoccus cholistanensis]MVA76202.1 ABC transporter substrate-binding protein [Auraticoccus cholistanensis]
MTDLHLGARGRRLLTVPAIAAALALTAAGCGTGTADAETGPVETVSITDSQGRTVAVPKDPEVVVATDWSVVRTLNDLGVEVDAVPSSAGALPEDLARYAGDEVPKIGGVKELDYEAINALEPDVVLVGSRSGTPEIVAEMEKITPAVVDMSVRPETPEQTLPLTTERVVQLGSIFGLEAEAEQRMAEATAAVEEVAAKAEESGETAMFVQVSGGTASAYGPGSRFGTIYSDYGFVPTDAPVDDEGGHGQEISAEFFAEYDPDVVYVLDRAKAIGDDETPALDVLDNGLVNSTTAARNGKVLEVDGFAWYLANAAPSSIEQMTADVDRAFSAS